MPEDMLIEFHDAMGLPVNNKPTHLEYKRYQRHFALIMEEYHELCDELTGQIYDEFITKPDPKKVVKEFADLLYVIYSLAVETGYWPYIEEAFYRVHESNMTKVSPETGKVEYREDGKVLKGPNYQPPNFDDMYVKYS